MAILKIEPAVLESNGSYTVSNLSVTSNVTAGSVYAGAYFYSNGLPFIGGGGGTLLTGTSNIAVVVDSFVGTGSQTSFSLSAIPNEVTNTIVTVSGISQPRSSYTVNSNTITFGEAPPATAVVEVTSFVANSYVLISGQTGYTGSAGEPGSLGYTGSAGAGYTGSQGDTGYTGSIGYTGSKGDQGTPGTSVTIVDSVQYFANLNPSYGGNIGDGYIISTSGNLAVWTGSVWDEVGRIIGYTGSQGDLGYTGSQGDTGYTGSQGDIGYTGPTGYTGSAGEGYTGSQGDIGYTGSQGDTGYTGSQGTAGTSVTIVGSVQYFANLNPSYSGGAGDGYIISTSGNLAVWSGSIWNEVGRIIGYTGSAGVFDGNIANITVTGTAQFLGNVDLFGGTVGNIGSPLASTDAATKGYVDSALTGISSSSISDGDSSITVSDPGTGNIIVAVDNGSRAWFTANGVYSTAYFFANGAPFVSAAGNNGYTGSQGATGYTGSYGDKGDTGDKGYTGSQGSIGYTGSGGIGYTGSQGDIGYTGSQGDIGYTGSGGLGYTGSQGATGYTGSVPLNPTFESITVTGNVNIYGGTVGNVGTPIAGTDVATKNYVDTALTGISSTSISDGDTSITVSDPGTGNIVVAVDNSNTSWFTTNGVYAKGFFFANGTPFVSGGGGGVTYTASNTAPTSPTVGDQWYKISSNILFEYISDGTVSYWVDISSSTVAFNANASLGGGQPKFYGMNIIFGGY